ncbi:hypothetical protein Tco_0768470, partial [Tanacetum coccineum]
MHAAQDRQKSFADREAKEPIEYGSWRHSNGSRSHHPGNPLNHGTGDQKRLKRSRRPLVKVRLNSMRALISHGTVKIRSDKKTQNFSQTCIVIYYKVLSFEDKALLTGGD